VYKQLAPSVITDLPKFNQLFSLVRNLCNLCSSNFTKIHL